MEINKLKVEYVKSNKKTKPSPAKLNMKGFFGAPDRPTMNESVSLRTKKDAFSASLRSYEPSVNFPNKSIVKQQSPNKSGSKKERPLSPVPTFSLKTINLY